MKLQVKAWVDDVENAVPEERATVASFQIHIGKENATVHIENGKESECLTGSVYGLADGMVREWWRIFGGRDEPVAIRRYRDGYVLPDVRLRVDDILP